MNPVFIDFPTSPTSIDTPLRQIGDGINQRGSRSITFFFLCLFALGTSLFASEKSPNILFIVADDQSPYDLKVYDPNSPLDTPVLDQLAA
ncbi:hypothetical protein N9270_06480, partial [Akkermansiaceae bacterium]|nr:hypothetical protein [Akkermansiaceae bacterium]